MSLLVTGSLDDDPAVRPERSIWWEHRAVWFKDINEIPKYPENFDANKIKGA